MVFDFSMQTMVIQNIIFFSGKKSHASIKIVRSCEVKYSKAELFSGIKFNIDPSL